ncbi:hypothetical protein J7I93_15585 [Bacillus sp. ISL-47]|uniref:hypothetical protein n=1 Tax=Bacillus sp. ISL-47 TaxID=2819130 RepID=UPI001BE593DF|nr:hypothetical protein [Bacillus sp. ISL-47]MBT2689613.1 hypothetical protein [Bacillus sp. ISL-47]MBT2708432.1 hypothetical protein [Pseudomonas sp. ISL-84]
MKNTELIKEQSYSFTTSVTEASQKEDFIVELFEFGPDMDSEGLPLKVLTNFDELIDFIEEMDMN